MRWTDELCSKRLGVLKEFSLHGALGCSCSDSSGEHVSLDTSCCLRVSSNPRVLHAILDYVRYCLHTSNAVLATTLVYRAGYFTDRSVGLIVTERGSEHV